MNTVNDIGFRVVRVKRVRVDDTVYETATAASEASSKLAKANPTHEYAIAHLSYPLDGDAS